MADYGTIYSLKDVFSRKRGEKEPETGKKWGRMPIFEHKNGGVYRPISAPLFMRGKPLTAHFSQLSLAIKTATYATFLPKKENKPSKNERRVQQVDRADF